jgi:hypothetical protein
MLTYSFWHLRRMLTYSFIPCVYFIFYMFISKRRFVWLGQADIDRPSRTNLNDEPAS